MSANIVRGFLPGVEEFVGSTAWSLVFPPRVELRCPRPQLSLRVPSWLPLAEEGSLTVMWPVASICCLLGIVLGFAYGITLLYKAIAKNAAKGTFTWGCAFSWYGLMSLGGLFYHCIYPIKPFYFLDLVSTACACVSLLAAYRRPDDRSTHFRNSLLLTYGVFIILAIVGGRTVRNVLYLLPASLAFILGGHFVMKVRRGNHSKLLLGGSLASGALGISAVLLDQWFCMTLGPNFALLFWFFLGSDLAMVFLFHFAYASSATEASSRNPPKSKSP